MKEFKLKKLHDVNQLHEELEAAVPGLRPVEARGGRVAVMDLQSTGDEVIVRFPDEVDEKAVADVVRAHSPRPKAPAPDLDALLDEVESATNLQAFRVAFVKYERAKHPERRKKT